MARLPLRRDRVGLVTAILSTSCLIIFWIATQFRDWTIRGEFIAFYAGAGGMALMFHRWRRHGDRLARVLCLIAFGIWMIAVIVSSFTGANPGKPGFYVAATALLIGFVGAIVVLIRLYAHRPRDSTARPEQ
jgi:peptidoglycan/LPS O-acetylase OafA/YrhL